MARRQRAIGTQTATNRDAETFGTQRQTTTGGNEGYKENETKSDRKT